MTRNLTVPISFTSAVFGLTDCVEEIDAQRVFGYALFKDGKNTKLSYPLEKFDSDVAGRSFHNGRFIQRMREKAATLPKYYLLSITYNTYSFGFFSINRLLFGLLMWHESYMLMHFGNMTPSKILHTFSFGLRSIEKLVIPL